MSPLKERGGVVMGAAVSALALSGMLGDSLGTTYASYSDSALISGNVAGAGIWAPDPPTACGDPADYTSVIYGTPGDDVLLGGNQRQVLMGLGGDDILRGGNSGDCLVGGLGNDRIYGGTAKDVLIGGDDDDLLEGNNGKDLLDGGPGLDTCVGGNGVDVLQECENGDSDPTAPLRLTTPLDGSVLQSPTVSDALPAAVAATPTPSVATPTSEPDGGAFVEDPPEAPLVDRPEPVATNDDVTMTSVEPVEEVQP